MCTHRTAAPLAAVAREALGGPAGPPARGAFAVRGQVALAPVMHVARLAARAVGRVLLAVGCSEVYAFSMHVVLAYCTTTHVSLHWPHLQAKQNIRVAVMHRVVRSSLRLSEFKSCDAK